MTSERIKKARENAIFNALENGIKESDLLLKEADKAEYRIALKRGYKSELRFELYIRSIDIIKSIRHSNPKEEARGIDYWIEVLDFEQKLPVQIKSSDTGVNNFRSSQHYLNHGKRIVVLNTGPRTSISKFKINFNHEIRRIEKLAS